MNREQLGRAVASRTNLNQREAAVAVDAILKTIEDALKEGSGIAFSGFGKFHVAERGARAGRNPSTGERLRIAPSRVPRFTPGSSLKAALRGLPGDGDEEYGPLAGAPDAALAGDEDERL